MRKIKFRGLCVNTPNKWAIGDLLQKKEPLIFERSQLVDDDKGLFFKVKKETVSQFTGLQDKNGVEIYEGDFIKYSSVLFFVSWDDNNACFRIAELAESSSVFLIPNQAIVVGNIYQNPELLPF